MCHGAHGAMRHGFAAQPRLYRSPCVPEPGVIAACIFLALHAGALMSKQRQQSRRVYASSCSRRLTKRAAGERNPT